MSPGDSRTNALKRHLPFGEKSKDMNQDRKIWLERSGYLTKAGIARASVERLATGEPFSLTQAWSIVAGRIVGFV
jgi:hypothetical protein